MSVIDAKQSLALAITVERHNAQRFKEWSARFLPYDKSTSDFLTALVREELEHEQELVELFERTFNEPPQIAPLPKELQAYLAGLESLKAHYFVVDGEMAHTILRFALAVERFTRNFYANLSAHTRDSAMRNMFLRLSEYEAEHEQKFLQRIDMEQQKLQSA
jgi:rubrerythrin